MNFNKKTIYSAVLLTLPMLLTQNATAGSFVDLVGSGGGTKTDVELSKYLEGVAATSPELTDLLNSATDEASALKLIQEIIPDTDGAALDAAIVTVEMMQDAISQRAASLRQRSSRGEYNFGWNTWVSPLFTASTKDDSEGINGFDSSTAGIMIGADTFIIEDETFIGYSLGYTNTESTVNNSSKEVTSANGEFLMYAGWINEYYFADAVFNIGQSTVDSERTIGQGSSYAGDTNASASYDQYQMGFAGKVGATFDIASVIIEPSVGYSRQWLYQEDYSEQGSVASLRYDRETYDIQYAKAGLDLYIQIESSWGLITPRVSVNYAKDLNPNQRVKETVQLAIDDKNDKGSFQTVLGAKVGGDQLNTAIGATLAFSDSMSIAASISYAARDDYSAIGGNVSFVKYF